MTYYQQALAIAEELGDRLQMATTLGNFGHVYKAQGDDKSAIELYDRAIPILKKMGYENVSDIFNNNP